MKKSRYKFHKPAESDYRTLMLLACTAGAIVAKRGDTGDGKEWCIYARNHQPILKISHHKLYRMFRDGYLVEIKDTYGHSFIMPDAARLWLQRKRWKTRKDKITKQHGYMTPNVLQHRAIDVALYGNTTI